MYGPGPLSGMSGKHKSGSQQRVLWSLEDRLDQEPGHGVGEYR
jgi:hypothetical protein